MGPGPGPGESSQSLFTVNLGVQPTDDLSEASVFAPPPSSFVSTLPPPVQPASKSVKPLQAGPPVNASPSPVSSPMIAPLDW